MNREARAEPDFKVALRLLWSRKEDGSAFYQNKPTPSTNNKLEDFSHLASVAARGGSFRWRERGFGAVKIRQKARRMNICVKFDLNPVAHTLNLAKFVALLAGTVDRTLQRNKYTRVAPPLTLAARNYFQSIQIFMNVGFIFRIPFLAPE
jgi:hypothetical protein